ncbi:replication protein [Staphylococcus epidermidis]|uniref:replication protein n=1 Tax=Staphylococcus epidermidis TaxID=1282 RepID=UPI001E4FB97C|nr:replication protein [Staphylococcus epidermidis]MCD9079133.1 replication protein [Staphylococcus epidermidis]MEB7331821.1 replication protein [Staphylococcus epidermidis]
MTKDKRSNKWAFLIYEESTPSNYRDILEQMHIPYILSPWHNQDIDRSTGEIKKSHKHGALFFDSLKSYSQISELLQQHLNTPSYIEIIMSPKGMFDYFIHASNPDKTPYDVNDIESGCGFDLNKFLLDQGQSEVFSNIIDMIEDQDFIEFQDLVMYARQHHLSYLDLIIQRTYFFAKYLDSRRHASNHK